MDIAELVPLGRSMSEYKEMFNLTNGDLSLSILGCADGPASFNAEFSKKGGNIKSIDPLYAYDSAQIRTRIDEVFLKAVKYMEEHKSNYIWSGIGSLEMLSKSRMNSMEMFMSDFIRGRKSGRYIAGALPDLPFREYTFDIALCSHYLFIYGERISIDHHVSSIREMCRVARQVRVYPLRIIKGNFHSPYLTPVRERLLEIGIVTSLSRTNYKFQKGAAHMLIAQKT